MTLVALIGTVESLHCDTSTPDRATWKWQGTYTVVPSALEASTQTDARQVRLDRHATVPLPPYLSADLEFSVRYQLTPGILGSFQEHPIRPDSIAAEGISLDQLVSSLDYLESLFLERDRYVFALQIEARRDVDLAGLLQSGQVERRTRETPEHRQFVVLSHLRPCDPEGSALLLRNYPVVVGSLDTDLIRQINMFEGARCQSWQIEIDSVIRPYTADDLRSTAAEALLIQSQPLSARVPALIHHRHPESTGHDLTVVTLIPEIRPDVEYGINVDLLDPTRHLCFHTGIPEVDSSMERVLTDLAAYAVPFGPGAETCQRVLSLLLLYRYNCGAIPDYIRPDVAAQDEIQGYQSHLTSHIGNQLTIRHVHTEIQPQLGNSRVDLLMEGIPVELKLEHRRTATTDDTVAAHQQQAADYAARQGAPFGVLMVLDTVLDRGLPTSPVSQDLRVTQVLNTSGAFTTLIAIVTRIPQPASTLR